MSRVERVERAEKRETLADIVAEMRKNKGFPVPYAPSGYNGVWTANLVEYADRIEAAAKRERAEIEADALSVGGVVEAAAKRATADKSSAVGNGSAMREVVMALAAVILPSRDKAGEDGWLDWVRAMQEKARAALAKPPRNCEVGTLTEQQQRFHDFCEKMQHTDKACCGGCPIVHLRMQGVISNSCELAWGQMPYEEGDAK